MRLGRRQAPKAASAQRLRRLALTSDRSPVRLWDASGRSAPRPHSWEAGELGDVNVPRLETSLEAAFPATVRPLESEKRKASLASWLAL